MTAFIDPLSETPEELYEHAPVGYLTTTPDGRVLRVNSTLLHWTGLQREDLIGRPWFDILLSPAGRIFVETHLEPLLKLSGSVREMSLEFLCANQRRLPVLLYVSRKEEPSLLRIVVAEVTDRRRYERDLLKAKNATEDANQALRELTADLEQRIEERTAALQAANEQLDAFSYAVSHDLRAPLRTLLGYSSLFRQEFADDLPAGAIDYLGRIERSAHEMRELIEGLLQLSQSTRDSLHLELVDLSAVAHDILQGFRQLEPDREVTWKIEAGLVATADVRLITSALQNLLGNAWKFTSRTPGARIRFHSEPREQPWYCISDNGPGFDATRAAQLFQPFHRLHTAAQFPGTGIGLATVQRIIKRHGGDIEARSEPGAGATFCFWLPDRVTS